MQCMFTKIAMVDFEIVQTGCVIILSATLTIKVVHLVPCFLPCYGIIACSKSKHPEYNAWFYSQG